MDEDDGLERGDEIPYRPWWLTEEGTARMRAIESDLKTLSHELSELKSYEHRDNDPRQFRDR